MGEAHKRQRYLAQSVRRKGLKRKRANHQGVQAKRACRDTAHRFPAWHHSQSLHVVQRLAGTGGRNTTETSSMRSGLPSSCRRAARMEGGTVSSVVFDVDGAEGCGFEGGVGSAGVFGRAGEGLSKAQTAGAPRLFLCES